MGKVKQRPRPGRKGPNRRPGGSARGPERDFIESAVRTGYEVSEAWLRQGTRFARQLSRLPYPRVSVDSVQYRRMLELYMEMVSNWFDLIGNYSDMLGSTRRSRDGREADDSFEFGQDFDDDGSDYEFEDDLEDDLDDLSWEDRPSQPEIIYDVQSPYRVRVNLTFHEGQQTNRVRVPSLTPVNGGSSPITVECQAQEDGTLAVRIQADETKTPGQYVGVVVDDPGNRPVGTLNVELT